MADSGTTPSKDGVSVETRIQLLIEQISSSRIGVAVRKQLTSLSSLFTEMKERHSAELGSLAERIENLEKERRPEEKKRVPERKKQKRVPPRPAPSPIVCENSVLVYPKHKEVTSERVKELMTQAIEPNKGRLQVKKLRKVRHGGVLMECGSVCQAEYVVRQCEKKLFGIETRLPSKRRPQVIFYGVPASHTKEQLPNLIRRQNPDVVEADLEMLFPIKSKRDDGKNHWVARVSPSCFQALLRLKKISLGWDRLTVREFVREVRCFRCNGLGHFRKDCSEPEDLCARCGEAGHKHKECTKEPKCVNCVSVNEHFSQKLETGHSSLDPRCPCVRREKNLIRERTQYSPAVIDVSDSESDDSSGSA